MPEFEIPPSFLARFGRGLVGSGLLRPLGYAAAIGAGGWAATTAINAYGHQKNPPLQAIDVNGDKVPDVLFDTRTGRATGYGPNGVPSDQGTPDRKNEDLTKTALYAAGAVGIAVALAIAFRGS